MTDLACGLRLADFSSARSNAGSDRPSRPAVPTWRRWRRERPNESFIRHPHIISFCRPLPPQQELLGVHQPPDHILQTGAAVLRALDDLQGSGQLLVTRRTT